MATGTRTTMEEILAVAKDPQYRRVETARILLRNDLRLRHAELEEELMRALREDAMRNDEPESPAILAAIEELEAEIEAAQVTFRFRQVGHREWADLMRQHPPTPQQIAEARRNKQQIPDHNEESFWPAAFAASCVEPEMTVEQARELIASLQEAHLNELRIKCLLANVGGDGTPKSLVAGAIRHPSEQSASTPAREGSLAQPS